jgi:hypothetical protein
MSLSEAGFNVRRATDAAMTQNIRLFNAAVALASPGYGGKVTWQDPTNLNGSTVTYYYQVQSYKPDANYWTPLIGPLAGPGAGIPTTLPNIVSPWSGAANVSPTPIISASPASITFNGTQAYLTTSASQTVTVTSAGTVNLLMSIPTITGANPGDFALTTNCPVNPTPLVSTATCTIKVTFKPTYAGTRLANLVIPSNDPVTPLATIPLTGTGGKVPLTIIAPTLTSAWTATGLPALVPTMVGLANGDTASLFNITCTTTYKAGGLAGTFSTSCLAATNVNNAYTISYVTGKLTVTAVPATMISPTPGIKFAGTTATFTWTTGGAQSYSLSVGTSPGSHNVYWSGSPITVTTKNVTGLPTTGVTLYARLTTIVNGVSTFIDYTYTASGTLAPATLISPAPGSTTTGITATFTWTTGNGAGLYAMALGTKPGTGDLYLSGWTSATSVTVNVLPANNSTVYVRLYSLVNGIQQYIDYTITSK